MQKDAQKRYARSIHRILNICVYSGGRGGLQKVYRFAHVGEGVIKNAELLENPLRMFSNVIVVYFLAALFASAFGNLWSIFFGVNVMSFLPFCCLLKDFFQ